MFNTNGDLFLCARIIIWTCFCCCVVLTFNLDDKLPLIKRGDSGSYFGFSVAQHKVIQNGDAIPWILVGAPLGQNLQPGTNRSGAFFKCPLTTSSADCKQVITDGYRLEKKPLEPPKELEIKDGQWLGSSVSSGSTDSEGGRIAVCAHRYAIRENDEVVTGKGLCYIFNQNFGMNDVLEPCLGRSHKREHEEYGFCQAGTSASFVKDTFMVGAPGPFSWTGMAFVYKYSDQEIPEVWETKVEEEPIAEEYSYRGMSVTSGYFLDKRKMSYAMGAPRANKAGAVYLTMKPDSIKNIIKFEQVLYGEQFGSGYGFELLAADVNGDGWDDLIVGAPYYYTQDNGGAVYIYLNQKGNFSKTYTQRILGPRTESRFGISLASFGDLNKDGFDDIAIGAPENGNGGAVYIFMGSMFGLEEKHSQIIQAGMGSLSELTTFGYSLSAGLDMDNNGYPDLLVGAFNSDAVVLLRSRPIIDITTEIREADGFQNIIHNVKGCKRNPTSDLPCFSFEICTRVKGDLQGSTVKHHLIAEPNKYFSRVGFDNQSYSLIMPNEITYEFKSSGCKNHTMYLKQDITDLLNPIEFQLTYDLVNRDLIMQGSSLPSLDQMPILNNSRKLITFEANFFKQCGDDNICTSDLIVNPTIILKNNEYFIGDKRDFQLHIKVNNEEEPAYEPWIYVIHSNTLYYVSSKIRQKSNVACRVHNSTVVACFLPNPFTYTKGIDILIRFEPIEQIEQMSKQFEFTIFANSTSQEFKKREPEKLIVNIRKESRISITGTSKPEKIYYSGAGKGEAAIKNDIDIGNYAEHVYNIYNDGPSPSDKLEVQIFWPHQVENYRKKGKWLLYLLEAPTLGNQEQGRCIINENLVNPLGLKVQNKIKNNFLNENITDYQLNRIKRDLDFDAEWLVTGEENKAHYHDASSKITAVGCQGSKPRAKCITFNCIIEPLLAGYAATITIKSRLWNATLNEDFKEENPVIIESFAKILSVHKSVVFTPFHMASTKVYPDLLERSNASFNLWYMIGSALIGLLVLLIVIFILWRCGFMKRKRPEPFHRVEIQKEEENKPLFESNKIEDSLTNKN